MEECGLGNAGRLRSLRLAILWILSYFAARLLLKNGTFPTWERVAISFIPIPFFAWFVWSFLRAMREADELERRIKLEALAIAFPLSLLLLMTLGLLERAIELPFDDWSYAHIWLYLPLFYIVGHIVAIRRYS